MRETAGSDLSLAMSAFPHPNLGPSTPDPTTVSRLRRTRAVAMVLLVGLMLLVLALERDANIFEGAIHRRLPIVPVVGFALVAGGTSLIWWSVRRARRAVSAP